MRKRATRWLTSFNAFSVLLLINVFNLLIWPFLALIVDLSIPPLKQETGSILIKRIIGNQPNTCWIIQGTLTNQLVRSLT
ncbi:hypothetical protein AHMF7605_01785 [Adhaeribacter arboris]|uniref:Uncharacterized protein n=1 Tax=Adhaeribacter arboris TaxID=2072846 RepID=A0A2T2Y9Y6_9BACT|nr:hypothetical protein AHMF7605_01785 [Adhaeribacter arboris]